MYCYGGECFIDIVFGEVRYIFDLGGDVFMLMCCCKVIIDCCRGERVRSGLFGLFGFCMVVGWLLWYVGVEVIFGFEFEVVGLLLMYFS